MEAELHTFLISALDTGDLSAWRPGRFTSGKRASGILWTRGWVGPRAGLDTVVKRKNPFTAHILTA